MTGIGVFAGESGFVFGYGGGANSILAVHIREVIEGLLLSSDNVSLATGANEIDWGVNASGATNPDTEITKLATSAGGAGVL